MSRFRYEALSANGEPVEGEIESTSYSEAVAELQRARLIIMLVQPVHNSLFRLSSQRNRVKEKEIVSFTQQLATLLEAGQPLEASLTLQLRNRSSRPLSALLQRLLDKVKSGSSLSSAMAIEGTVFGNFYLSLVRAGEATGMLGETLGQLANHLERTRSLRSDLFSALIYPVFLVVGVFGSLALLLAYVVPQFVPIFIDMNVPLPWITQFILALGEFFSAWGGWCLAILSVLALFVKLRLRRPEIRLALDRKILKFHFLGPLLQVSETARLALTMGTLLGQGVSLVTSLEIVARITPNQAIAEALQLASRDARNGNSLSSAMESTKTFPELAIQMIRVGEQSGQLAQMFIKLADIYDKQTQIALKRFMATLTPSLTIIMTALVALIMLAIIFPLISLTNSI